MSYVVAGGRFVRVEERVGAGGWQTANALWAAIGNLIGILEPDGCAEYFRRAGNGLT